MHSKELLTIESHSWLCYSDIKNSRLPSIVWVRSMHAKEWFLLFYKRWWKLSKTILDLKELLVFKDLLSSQERYFYLHAKFMKWHNDLTT